MRRLLDILAENVKHFRGDLSQEELARRAGIAVVVIRRIEQRKSWPELKNVEAIAKALGVEPADLFYKGAPPAPVPPAFSVMDALTTVRKLLAALEQDDFRAPIVKQLFDDVKKKRKRSR